LDAPDISPRPVFAAYLHQFITYGFLQALRTNLFPTLNRLGQATTGELAAAMGVAPAMLDNLLDMLGLLELVAKDSQATPARYRLQPAARVYLPGPPTPWDLSGFDAVQEETWATLMAQGDSVLRTGTPAQRGTPSSRERWASVVQAIGPLALQQGHLLVERIHHDLVTGDHPGDPYDVLDAGCGVGRLGALILQAVPNTHVTGADFPAVLELATEIMQHAGLGDRFTALPVDLTKEIPRGPRGPYAACVASMFCQVLSEPQLQAFFELAGQAVRPGGWIGLLDCLPDDARQDGERWIELVFSYMMSFVGGRAYTAADYRRLLGATGWGDVTITRTNGVVTLVQARRL
jgi:SAM-dependent methyltransferase